MPETSISVPEANTPNENAIFEAILQGEQSTSPAEEAPVPAAAPPAE